MTKLVKILTTDKDCRLVVADTQSLAARELADFNGSPQAKQFLSELITCCVLYGGINDFYTKISFLLRLRKGWTIFCELKHGEFALRYPDVSQVPNLGELIDQQATLSITTGDWSTGLHTGTVSFEQGTPSQLFTHFSRQSEQLPSDFIVASDASTGCLLQALPYADPQKIAGLRQQLAVETIARDWQQITALGTILWQQTMGARDGKIS